MQQHAVFYHFKHILSWLIIINNDCEGVKAKSVTADPVNCNAMSMTFFDRLYDNNVVRDSGHIVKCFDDLYEDFIISDELRKAGCVLFCTRHIIILWLFVFFTKYFK